MQDEAKQADETPPVVEKGPDLVDELTQQVNANNWVPEAMQPMWAYVEQYPIIGAVCITVIGYAIAKLVMWMLNHVVGRLTQKTRSDFDDRILLYLRRPVFATVFYSFLAMATISLDLSQNATDILVRLLASLVVLFWTTGAFPVIALLLEKASNWQDKLPLIESRTMPLFDMIGKLLVVLVGTYALLQIWHIDPTAWLASAGVLGIAIGFAARDTLANLFSGVFIVADAPYKIGDFVNLDSGERGMVTHVGLRSTRLLTRDDVEITIPNSVIGNAKIVNEAGGRWTKMRVRAKVGVAYGSDVDQVCAILLDVANSHEAICKEPEARVRMRGFGDSSLDFELLGWIDEPVKRGKVLHELLMSIYKRFAAESIEIPFPQRDLHLRSDCRSTEGSK